jgi:DNA replication protein DnaC
MVIQQTLKQLAALNLSGMAKQVERFMEDPTRAPLSNEEYLGALVDAEIHAVRDRKQERLMKAAKLKYPNACVEDINYSASRGLDRQVMLSLANCQWVERKQNAFFLGPSGVGKTHIACAVGNQIIRKGYSVVYKRTTRLLEEMEIARGDGSIVSLRNKIQKTRVLILDDWGVAPMTSRGRLDLLDLIEDKADSGSLIITSQMPLENWHTYLGEPAIADAILDRIVHRAHRICLHGESMRKLSEKI